MGIDCSDPFLLSGGCMFVGGVADRGATRLNETFWRSIETALRGLLVSRAQTQRSGICSPTGSSSVHSRGNLK
jgi:hypothetical protein